MLPLVLASSCNTGAWASTAAEEPVQAAAPAQTQPLWEFGLGLGGLSLPEYRGSERNRAYLAPLPYFIYRGTWFKADREGTRALLLEQGRLKLDLSLGATPPSRTRGNTARAGMPDIPGTVEIGPNLNLLMAASEPGRWRLELRLPVRAAYTLESSPRFAGSTFSPNLNLDIAQVAGGWNVGLLTGPLFADAKNHGLFYNVDTAYATPTRPRYGASAGYSGWRALAAASRRFGDTWVGTFVRYDHLGGATFEGSPLAPRTSALSMGLGVAWFFARSSERVSTND